MAMSSEAVARWSRHAGRRSRAARACGIRADDVPAQRAQRHLHPRPDLGRPRALLRRPGPVRRRDVGVPQPERLRRDRVLDVRRLLAGPRPLHHARASRRVRSPRHGERCRTRWPGSCSRSPIFNTYMLIASARVNTAVFRVFLTLEITEILLVIGFFNASHGGRDTCWLHAGGWVGIVTAAVAWYTSAAGVLNGVSGRPVVPGRKRRCTSATVDGARRRQIRDRSRGTRPCRSERPRDRDDVPRGAAVPAARGVRRAGERASRTSTTRLRGVLGARGRERVTWFEPFTELYEWEPPYAKWYLGGKLNVCFNCVDRHVEAGAGDKVAFHWEGEPEGEPRTITYADLQRDVVRFANALKELGVKKGTPVGDLHGHGPGAAGGDARVHAARRAAHRRLRRLLGRLALGPDERHELRGAHHAGRGLAARLDGRRSRGSPTRRWPTRPA